MNRILTAGLGAVAALAMTGPAFAGDDGTGRKLSTSLSGAAEVPGPGDTDGTGGFSGRINPGTGELCYTLTASMIDTATMAHIHSGATGVAGPVVVALAAPADGSSEACVTVAKDLAMKLVQSPQDYYVNVHNAAFPGGAVRGQLAK